MKRKLSSILGDGQARLEAWVRQQMQTAAETIGYDLETIPRRDRWAALLDYAADQMFAQTGEQAEAFRLMDQTKRNALLKREAKMWSL